MRILWLSWKDRFHPEAGGAEVVTGEILRRCVEDGHEVVLITSRPAGAAAEVVVDGYRIFRGGNRLTVYLHAMTRYWSQFRLWPDLVIDECNTIPFFAAFYSRQPVVMFFHQLCRRVWLYQIFLPLGILGYILEALYLRLLSRCNVVTVSDSTKRDLERFGFTPEKIAVIPEGIQLVPLKCIEGVEKAEKLTILSLGSIRPMKRTLDIVKAFEYAKEALPDLRLVIAGADATKYGQTVRRYASKSRFSDSIEWKGPVGANEKVELLRSAHLVAVASVKEGWCLVVTEANSQGTAAVGYDVDGLRDSIRNGETGFLSEQNPEALAQAVVKAMDPTVNERFRRAGLQFSKSINFENSFMAFRHYCINSNFHK